MRLLHVSLLVCVSSRETVCCHCTDLLHVVCGCDIGGACSVEVAVRDALGSQKPEATTEDISTIPSTLKLYVHVDSRE
jgi:hypothetical protein